MLGRHDSENESYAGLRKFLRYSWIAIGVAALYVGGVFLSRWQENRQIERQAIEKKRAEAARAVELLGGDRFEILHFYAYPGIIRRGETTQLCYGASNTKKARLDPPAAKMWPALNRCFDISPAKTTAYTLTIEDAAGNSKSASLTVQVR